jgi:two-component system, OmpR family, response regulator
VADELTREDGTPIRVLVVEDEEGIASLLSAVMSYEGWTCVTASSGRAGLAAARTLRPDVVVLDVMLPDADGFALLPRLREQDPDVCVLFLTARDRVEDRIAGISIGGDDYITKPFSIQEVVTRIRGLLRRANIARRSDSVLVVGGLRLDEDSREVSRDGEPISLTPTEFELLRLLMLNARTVLSKAQILDRVWHYDFGGDAHVVELFISYLRKKIDHGRPPMIHTVRGVGYLLKPAD